MSELPHFRVLKVEQDPLRLIGDLSSTRYGSQIWIQSGWLGDLRIGSRFLTGRWSEAGACWAFSPDDQNALESIAEVRDFEVFDGYWGERAELVLDESLNWREAIWSVPDEHDHCRICWGTIDSAENTSHFAASAQLRVCPACHSSYVQPRNIDFSQLGGPVA
jgi:hypothetical protein